MKKLFTIICAFSLIMAFTLPAMADTDVDVDDTQAAAALLGQTNQAQKGGEIDNDGLDVDTGDIASGNSQDNDNTDVDVTTGDLLSNNSDDDNVNLLSGNTDKSDDDVVDNKGGAMDNDLVDQDGDQDLIDQDNTDNDLVDQDGDQDVIDQDGDQDVIDQDNTDNDLADNDMNDNVAAAAMGGFAIGVSIDDIELNLASTTSITGIYQENEYGADTGSLFAGDDVGSEFKSECHSVDASVYSNTGITGANFTAGNFNNAANLNNVTMTIQW